MVEPAAPSRVAAVAESAGALTFGDTSLDHHRVFLDSFLVTAFAQTCLGLAAAESYDALRNEMTRIGPSGRVSTTKSYIARTARKRERDQHAESDDTESDNKAANTSIGQREVSIREDDDDDDDPDTISALGDVCSMLSSVRGGSRGCIDRANCRRLECAR